MSAFPDKSQFRFEVAISFAGPHREKVRTIAQRLSDAIDPGLEDRSRGRVFFDEWFEHEILGSDMDVLLQDFYHRQSLMVVADVSEEYTERPWTQAEARAIRALRFELNAARDETARLRLLNARFGDGEVPGVFKTEGTLDGIHKSPEECANVILKRRELLRERLGKEREGEAQAAQADPQATPKGWVWHSTLATRAAGQVSVLAVLETLLAIVLYWWIAIRFETHWHLVSSVFVAPLLLLRSPESKDAGVRWFLMGWLGLSEPKNWKRGKLVCSIIVTNLVTYCFASELSHRWLTGLQGWHLFVWAAAIGATSIAVAVAIAIVFGVAIADAVEGQFSGAIAGAGAITGSIGGTFAITGAGAIAGAGAVAGAIAIVVAVAVAVAVEVAGSEGFRVWAMAATIPIFGVGIAIRALVFRVLATLLHLQIGVRHLAANWRENNFLTDCGLPAELMPGIRELASWFTLDGQLKVMSKKTKLSDRIVRLLFAIIVIFLPAFLYRLNIKATAWFWWPLAYLLKPAPADSAEGAQRQALCWPWSNPAQRLLIVLSIGLALLSLVLHWLVATSRIESGLVTSLPMAVRVLLGWGWARLAPWHVALWIIAGTGAGMLLLAGNACSQQVNGNWSQYRQRWPQNVRVMTALSRVRRLATIALLIMSLGALLLQDRTWQTYLPVPASWIAALEGIFQQSR